VSSGGIPIPGCSSTLWKDQRIAASAGRCSCRAQTCSNGSVGIVSLFTPELRSLSAVTQRKMDHESYAFWTSAQRMGRSSMGTVPFLHVKAQSVCGLRALRTQPFSQDECIAWSDHQPLHEECGISFLHQSRSQSEDEAHAGSQGERVRVRRPESVGIGKVVRPLSRLFLNRGDRQFKIA